MLNTITYAACLGLLLAILVSDWTILRSGSTTRWLFALSPHVNHSKDEDWDLFRHLGGNGPWIPHATDYIHRCQLPDQCSVTQAHMISRHAERYPTLNAGKRHLALLQKLKQSSHQLRGTLSFAKNWTYFTDEQSPQFEKLTTTGPFAGTSQAFNTGKKLREVYDHLVLKDHVVNFWSCASPRDVETAQHFANGFFGTDWESIGVAKLHVIPETSDRGADTLTPGRTCRGYRNDQETGRDVGYSKLREFQILMADSINERLHHDSGGLEFTPLEIYGMMEFCGFEIMVRGGSPWCEVFTHDEWSQYEYARDLLHFYRSGPGNPYAGTLGWLWLNATTEQLSNDSAKGVYLSFVHDGDIIPLLATLGFFNEDGEAQALPSDRIAHSRRWKTSDIVPMGGRLVFERVDCISENTDGPISYVRLIVNDGPLDLGHFIDGAKSGCGIDLDTFRNWVDRKGEVFDDFQSRCGTGSSLPSSISFLHQ